MTDLTEGPSRFDRAIRRIDEANTEDPSRIVHDGSEQAREVVHARRRSEWLLRLVPDADDLVRIAARALHVRRWAIPRSEYPMGRAGYHEWRRALAKFHAATTAKILNDLGFAASEMDKAARLIRTKGASADPERQALEDVACLAFFEFDLEAFTRGQTPEKLGNILRRTWRKMSPSAQELVRTEIILGSAWRLIEESLEGQ